MLIVTPEPASSCASVCELVLGVVAKGAWAFIRAFSARMMIAVAISLRIKSGENSFHLLRLFLAALVYRLFMASYL